MNAWDLAAKAQLERLSQMANAYYRRNACWRNFFAIITILGAVLLSAYIYMDQKPIEQTLGKIWPLGVVEVVLLFSTIIFARHARDWREFVKRNNVEETNGKEDGTMKAMGVIFCVLLAIAAIMGLGWVVQGNDFFMYKVFAPKYENVRRQVFENTKSYNQGTIQEVAKYKLEYDKSSDPAVKQALASAILHEVADFPEDRLPVDLRMFIEKLKSPAAAISVTPTPAPTAVSAPASAEVPAPATPTIPNFNK